MISPDTLKSLINTYDENDHLTNANQSKIRQDKGAGTMADVARLRQIAHAYMEKNEISSQDRSILYSKNTRGNQRSYRNDGSKHKRELNSLVNDNKSSHNSTQQNQRTSK